MHLLVVDTTGIQPYIFGSKGVVAILSRRKGSG